MTNKFNFFVPAEIEKAKDEKGNAVMRVKGIASTADNDAEGEVLEPVGYELKSFLKNGFINYNHLAKSDASKIIGEPEKAKITKDNKLYLEGKLYNTPTAKGVYKLANQLVKSGSSRQLGWSIEGKALERDPSNPKRITKALITGVAITPCPVNSNTYVDVVKGLQKEDYIGSAYSDDETKGGTTLLSFKTKEGKVTIDENFSIQVHKKDKAATTDNTGMLANESLDGKTKKLDIIMKKYQDKSISRSLAKKLISKVL